jgi:hypothetical protein
VNGEDYLKAPAYSYDIMIENHHGASFPSLGSRAGRRGGVLSDG